MMIIQYRKYWPMSLKDVSTRYKVYCLVCIFSLSGITVHLLLYVQFRCALNIWRVFYIFPCLVLIHGFHAVALWCLSYTGFIFSQWRCKWLWTAICYLATLQRVGLYAHLLSVWVRVCVLPLFTVNCLCWVTVFLCLRGGYLCLRAYA